MVWIAGLLGGILTALMLIGNEVVKIRILLEKENAAE